MTNLFIWDDYNWMLIEGSDDYDQTSFFIVRKLFVQWPKKGYAAVCNDLIRQYFESYGNVESVHTVNEESTGANSINASDIHEAYVTFVRSEDAYNAFVANRRGSKAIKVLPADTWRQPGVDINPPEEIKGINDADPFCEEEMAVADMLKGFCECGQVILTVHLHQPLGLKKVFESFRPIKNRVNHFKVIFDVKPNDIQVNCLTDGEYVKRVIQVLCTCVGERFNELTISSAETITLGLLDDFAPMLQRLKGLTLTIMSNASVLYALPEYCPNLEDLELNAMSWDGECSDAVPQRWPSILDLVLGGNLKIDSDTASGEKFQRFIELNPQLKTLILNTIVDTGTFSTITQHLPDLSNFGFGRMTYDDIELLLDQLTGMKHLTAVKISILKVVKDGLKAMATCAERLSKMEKLKLAILFQNLEPDTVQKEEYERLFSCAVKHHNGCKCHGSERVLEISEVVAEEKPVVKLPKDRPVLVASVNTKNFFESADTALMPKVTTAFEGTKQFYPNVINKMLVRGQRNFLSIYISHA